jgi:hypothetical protein
MSTQFQRLAREKKRQKMIHDMKMEHLCSSLEDPHVNKSLVQIYKKTYGTNCVGSDLRWRKSSAGGVVLWDDGYQIERIWIPQDMSSVLLCPPGGTTHKEKELNLNELCFPFPDVGKDVLSVIFRFFEPVELMKYRVVSKKWNKLITTQCEYWKLREVKHSPWDHCSLFYQYVQKMFVKITPKQFGEFIFKNPDYLYNIIDQPKSKVYMIGSCIKFSIYTICKTGKIMDWRNNEIDLNLFLRNYRQKIKCLP